MNIILAAVAGGLIVFLAGAAFYYRAILKTVERELDSAENERRDMVKVANDALDAKQKAEEGFAEAKIWFKKHLEQPLTAVMTDEQIESIAKYLSTNIWSGGKIQ